MISTPTRAATPAGTCAPALLDAVVLPAAVAAPSALVIAVEGWLAQETSVLGGLVLAGADTTAPRSAAPKAHGSVGMLSGLRAARSNDVEGSPSRGTPV